MIIKKDLYSSNKIIRKMRRTIPDTNFYGLLANDSERLEVVRSIKSNKDLVTYGFKVIRNELRDVPKNIKVVGRSLRIDLLSLYDELVENHLLESTSSIIKTAENYYKAYRELGGSKSKVDIINDFVIVSCASINNLDIVVSNDERSMLTENAIRAYHLINSAVSKRTPQFISYEQFKKSLKIP